jgi:hypothetical protein
VKALSSLHNLHLAPPVKIVDDLVAVPIDIQQLDTHVVFDMATRRAHVEAIMRFVSGIKDGNPIFDLRQDIIQAHLNDEMFPVEKLQYKLLSLNYVTLR